MYDESVIVIGAGIAGLTASALLAKEGLSVTLLEAHSQIGGCAGTFRRGPYVFDVGATQVAGLESGGIHARLFNHLNIPLPDAEILDSACLVDLGDGSKPIELCYDPVRWLEECETQFPGTQKFWKLCAALHQSNWAFSSRDPVLPFRSTWDVTRFLQALGPFSLASGLLSRFSIGDLLKICRCHHNERLRKFLDLQLKLYSQETADRTAALYGATVLQMAQYPRGLWHLHGSMQNLSNLLKQALIRDGGELLVNHRVTALKPFLDKGYWEVEVINSRRTLRFHSADVICTLPPQSLIKLISIDSGIAEAYKSHLEGLPRSSSAFVFYGAIERKNLASDLPSHLQLALEDPGSLFLSISREGDGRAPQGQATLIASVFTESADWLEIDPASYKTRKDLVMAKIISTIENWLEIPKQSWLHKEFATPRSFARWTGRAEGVVGGLGQHPNNFGPFGLASRTPLSGLWLCGDSIYPGEGTAGVSQSALIATRQLMAKKGLTFSVAG